MKKIFLMLFLFVLGTGAATLHAQASKEYKKEVAAHRKAAEKMAKKQAKVLKKQKWEYTGVVPLETALANYYLETLEECGGEKKGVDHEVNDAKSTSAGEKRLLLNAQALYAQEVEAMLGADLANSTRAENGEDFESYVARVAAKVKHEFYGDISRAILLKKRNPNGKTYTMRGYFTINEKAGLQRAERVAKEVERNNGMIDSIHEKVFGDSKK